VRIVLAKKLIAVLLASAYFLSVAAQLACAETMESAARPAARPSVEAADDPCCHHHPAPADRSHRTHPVAPCCRTDSGPFALVNPAVVAPSAARGLYLGEIAANSVAASEPPRLTFASDPDPPGSRFRDPLLSTLSPRAPPFPPAVL